MKVSVQALVTSYWSDRSRLWLGRFRLRELSSTSAVEVRSLIDQRAVIDMLPNRP